MRHLLLQLLLLLSRLLRLRLLRPNMVAWEGSAARVQPAGSRPYRSLMEGR